MCENGESCPPSPADPIIRLATMHLYLCGCRIVDALLIEPDLEHCMEGEELRGTLYAVRLLASSIESLVQGSPALRKSHDRLMKKILLLDRGYGWMNPAPLYNPKDVALIASSPSAN